MNEKILIIEDEAAIRSILEELFLDAGYEVETAADGLEGLLQLKKQDISLVLLDIMMPKIDGYTVCEMIRRESDIPVIILTALDEEQAQVRAFQLKADDYITKPFSLQLVRMRAEAVLRRTRKTDTEAASGPGAGTGILACGDIRLNQTSYLVTAKGRPVSLTHTEYKLLELFMQHPGRVFTRDNLLNLVWGYDFIGEEKTVNIHIMNLRRKLDTDLIETIRGVGYRFGREN